METDEAMHSTQTQAIQNQSLDISVEYEQRGDYIYPIESEEDESEDSWDESNWENEKSWDDISVELDDNHPQGKEEILIDDVFEVEEGDEPGSASEDETTDQSERNIEEIVSDQTFIAYTRSTLQLLSEIPVEKCCVKACLSAPVLKQKRIGTALSVTWECERGHVSKKWNSQPKVRRNFAADISLSAAILLSGNNYSKIRMLFRCMNLGMCNSNLHYYIQRTYTCPAISEYWSGMQKDILDARKGQEVIVSGDGRNDSPGFSAQYCTYTCMDYNTSDILHVAVVDKRQVGLKSPNMEKSAFVESLHKLQESELIVKEVVTDAHPSIRAYLSFQKGCQPVPSPLDRGCHQTLLSRWMGLLHHVVGRHEWALGYGGGPARCEHETLPESWKDKSIKEGSPAHIALREIVLDKRLLSSVDYYTRFRHTGRLENFQSHILAYASKRFSYSYPSYKARNLLAAIDYQKHKDRKQKVIADKPIFRRHFHKGSDRWGVVPVKEAKAYSYMAELMREVFFKRVHDPSTQRSTVVLGEDDPRRLAPTIAPSQPPPTDELVRAHASRF
ncbi:hypothetical protein HOLleu_05492 [Holothuria leucospilota]|uniref:Uncharacterized protein n=1 Tax=Holothuria leucospilota TaxID=206669 RepID=A0A9Q1CK09_HOLLE|nr:hypothetical protein HOLleu_05492 [Holothuria leucospilota]